MRPRKKVYLHCQNKTRCAVLSCVLQTWGFRVITDLLMAPIRRLR